MEPGTFVDALFQGQWMEGYIMSFSLGILKVQLDYSLQSCPVSLRLSQVAEFRSRTKRNSGLSDLLTPVFIDSGLVFSLHGEVESKVKSKSYLKSEPQFVQFFAGLLPTYSKMIDFVPKRSATECVSILAEATTDFFSELKRQGGVLYSDSAIFKTWNSVSPVVERLLSELQSDDRAAKIFDSYIRSLALSGFHVSLLQSFSSFRKQVKLSYFSGNDRIRDMLFEASLEFIDFCLKLCQLREALRALLELGKLQELLPIADQKNEEINAAVQKTMQEMNKFPHDSTELSNEIVEIIVLYNKLFRVSGSSFLLMYKFLDEVSIQLLLLTPITQEEALRFSRGGFQLSFLNSNFQGVLWKKVLQEAMKGNANLAYLFDDDMCETVEELADVLPHLDTKQIYHLWEVAKGRISGLFRYYQKEGNFDMKQFQVRRRIGLTWVSSKMLKFTAIPKLLWTEIIEFAL